MDSSTWLQSRHRSWCWSIQEVPSWTTDSMSPVEHALIPQLGASILRGAFGPLMSPA